MRNALIAAAVVTLVSHLSAQTPVPASRLELSFEPGGRVTLVAAGVSVRDVLAEWTKKGGTPFGGAERLPATPLTLQYEHRPEAEVIGSLLRSAAGVVIGPPRDASNGGSTISVVYVLATSSASAVSYSAPSVYVPPPQPAAPASADTEIPPVGPVRGQPTPDPAPASRPAGVGGVAVPVVPVVPVTTGPGRGGGAGGAR